MKKRGSEKKNFLKSTNIAFMEMHPWWINWQQFHSFLSSYMTKYYSIHQLVCFFTFHTTTKTKSILLLNNVSVKMWHFWLVRDDQTIENGLRLIYSLKISNRVDFGVISLNVRRFVITWRSWLGSMCLTESRENVFKWKKNSVNNGLVEVTSEEL